MTQPLIETPASVPGGTQYQQLAYVDAYDAVLDLDYAYVAYKETDGFGGWRVRVVGSQTAGAELDPAAIARAARAAGARGERSFPWGYAFEPSEADPRSIRFLVHVEGERPAEVELALRLRRADGGPGEERSVRFPWPAS